MEVLKEIISRKKAQVASRKAVRSVNSLINEIKTLRPARDFLSAISRTDRINIIAELKKASPSEGIIRPDFDVQRIAQEYESAGAAAISVLTEESRFMGDIYHLIEASENSKLPILRKDFIVDAYQIYESRCFSADAVLLICSILSKEELCEYCRLAGSLNSTPIVEVHNEKELEEVLTLDAVRVIGINNRNLFTLEVDTKISQKLLHMIPPDRVAVIESGIKTSRGIERFLDVRANAPVAFLIGTAFMRAESIKAKFAEIIDDKN